MSEEIFSRAAARAPDQKPLAFTTGQLAGKSNAQVLARYPQYKAAEAAYNNCMLYAGSYSAIMMKRVLDEEPDILEERGMSKPEFEAHLQNNLCLGLSKYRAAVLKDTQAKIQEDGYLNDKIRRLTNGGDRFHPYL